MLEIEKMNTVEQIEEWKDIPGCEGRYQVSSLSRVRSVARIVVCEYNQWGRQGQLKNVRYKEKILNPGIPKNKRSYMRVNLGTSSTRILHRLIAEAFIANPHNLPEVNHKNGIKTDNRLENLEWVSKKTNMNHAFETGLNPRCTRILDTSTGKVYRSMEMAAKDLGKSSGHYVRYYLKTKRRFVVQ